MNSSVKSQCQACFDLAYDSTFYVSLFDTIHCLWFHSNHLGLRTRNDPFCTTSFDNDYQQLKQKSFEIQTEARPTQIQGIVCISSSLNLFSLWLVCSYLQSNFEMGCNTHLRCIIGKLNVEEYVIDPLNKIMTRNK